MVPHVVVDDILKELVPHLSKGGKLLEFAEKHALPHVVLPPTKIQPRSGLGFQMLALAALLHRRLDGAASLASLRDGSGAGTHGRRIQETDNCNK
jgi:hypothetical protein